jgi:hypothetical protein
MFLLDLFVLYVFVVVVLYLLFYACGESYWKWFYNFIRCFYNYSSLLLVELWNKTVTVFRCCYDFNKYKIMTEITLQCL